MERVHVLDDVLIAVGLKKFGLLNLELGALVVCVDLEHESLLVRHSFDDVSFALSALADLLDGGIPSSGPKDLPVLLNLNLRRRNGSLWRRWVACFGYRRMIILIIFKY